MMLNVIKNIYSSVSKHCSDKQTSRQKPNQQIANYSWEMTVGPEFPKDEESRMRNGDRQFDMPLMAHGSLTVQKDDAAPGNLWKYQIRVWKAFLSRRTQDSWFVPCLTVGSVQNLSSPFSRQV